VELTVKIIFEGAFDEACDRADNSKVLPTDTMKNMLRLGWQEAHY
jgi:urate oxidase